VTVRSVRNKRGLGEHVLISFEAMGQTIRSQRCPSARSICATCRTSSSVCWKPSSAAQGEPAGATEELETSNEELQAPMKSCSLERRAAEHERRAAERQRRAVLGERGVQRKIADLTSSPTTWTTLVEHRHARSFST